MADQFDPSEFADYKASATQFDPKEFESFKTKAPSKEAAPHNAEAADHGLSERQKLSPIGKALSPITEYPATYDRMNREARGQISEGVNQMTSPDSLTDPQAHGISDVITGAAKTVAGGLGYVASPITAAYRSVAGQPIEDTTGIPREYTEFAAQLATPGLGFSGVSKAPGITSEAPIARPAQDSLAAASDRLAATGNQVDVPKAIATDSVAAQRTGQAVRNMPIIGDAIPKATARLSGQLEDATSNIASDFGGGSGPNVAHSIGQTIGTAAEQETAAAKAAAAHSDQAVLGAWENNIRTANDSIAGAEARTLQRARQAVGDMSPQDMGETVIARLRAGEQEARATKERLYGVAGESDGSINADAVRGVRARVAGALNADGRVIDEQLTPAANRMMTELDNISSLRIPNRVAAPIPAGSEVAAVNMQGIEQTRKRLNSLAQAASNDADRSAARGIIREFDNWLGDSFDNALFSGSDAALQSYRAARQANTEWRTRFGFNERDDADRVINRIVTGEVTPQEVSNYILGSTKVGSSGVSSRLLTRITEATGGDPDAMGAIRGGVWNRLSDATEGTTAKAPAKVADGINEFLNGSGRDVARRLFTDPQQAIMRTYANALRQGAEARGVVADIAANTRPSPMEVGIGPLQRLANATLGKSGGRSDEALYSAINSYAKSGARGDISLLSKVIQAIPEKDRGNLAGAMIKGMGVSPRTGQFSPDVFVSSWGTYKPEAKALLFGMSGPQRVALDDIAKISLRMKEVGSKFGNPSGTAQNVNFFALASSFVAAPLTTIAGAVGGAVTAKILSSPVGASSVSKWSRAYERLANVPNMASIESFKRATALLAVNVHCDTGMPIKDLVKQLQGPIPASADEKNNGSVGIREAQPN